MLNCNAGLGLILLGSVLVMSHTTCNEMLSNKVMTLLTVCSSDIQACRVGNLNKDSTIDMTTSEWTETTSPYSTDILTVLPKYVGTYLPAEYQQPTTADAFIQSVTEQTTFHNSKNTKKILKSIATTNGDTTVSTEKATIPLSTSAGLIQPDNIWVTLSNGYEYKFFKEANNWSNARATCHGIGGDLASFGIRSIETRRIMVQNLMINEFFWIGLNDITNDGIWYYITSYPSTDGDLAKNSTALWGDNQPITSTDFDCALVHQSNRLSYSYNCNTRFAFLCEKII